MTLFHSFKQAWREALQNPLFSGIYVMGVALAIASTLLFALVNYIRIAPIYPEYNRDRSMYIMSAQCSLKTSSGESHYVGYGLGYSLITDYLSQLENFEDISASQIGMSEIMALPEGGSQKYKIHVHDVDPAYFRMYDFKILAGHVLSQEDFDSHRRVAVIGDPLAKAWWGGPEEAIGRTFSINGDDYTVTGVVKQPSFLVNAGFTAQSSYAQAYLPFTRNEDYNLPPSPYAPLLGPYCVHFLVKDKEQGKALKAEVAEMLHRITAADSTNEINFYGTQPYDHFEAVMKEYSSDEFDTGTVVRKWGIVFLALLLVPALNLSGMIAGKMDGKMPEIGIRKSFGASRSKLLWQILVENLVLTGIGAIVGLIVAFAVFYAFRGSIAYLFFADAPDLLVGEEVEISADMLFNPAVFFGALGICLVLNLVAAIVPALLALKRPIVSSINQKR